MGSGVRVQAKAVQPKVAVSRIQHMHYEVVNTAICQI